MVWRYSGIYYYTVILVCVFCKLWHECRTYIIIFYFRKIKAEHILVTFFVFVLNWRLKYDSWHAPDTNSHRHLITAKLLLTKITHAPFTLTLMHPNTTVRFYLVFQKIWTLDTANDLQSLLLKNVVQFLQQRHPNLLLDKHCATKLSSNTLSLKLSACLDTPIQNRCSHK